LAEETEVLGENLLQRHFVHHKSHMTRPGFEPGPPRWEASYGAALPRGPRLFQLSTNHVTSLTADVTNLQANYYYYGSTAFCWTLGARYQFHDPIHSQYDSLDRGSARRKAATHTQNNTQTQNKGTQYRHPYLEWDSNPQSQRSSERR
jgi:hypothetical protein